MVIVSVCTSCVTHLRFEPWRPVRLAANASASTWWRWRPTCGHVNIGATYWYLETTPDLLREIATASEAFLNGGQP